MTLHNRINIVCVNWVDDLTRQHSYCLLYTQSILDTISIRTSTHSKSVLNVLHLLAVSERVLNSLENDAKINCWGCM